jgi:chaperone modulatory protein CbpM
VNDEGVTVILHLLDQMHGLRRSMQELLGELHASRRAGGGSVEGGT